MSHGELIYVSNDDHGRLVALLDDRRKMMKRHQAERLRKRSSRSQGTLAEKLAMLGKHKDELAQLNTQIDALTKATGEAA